MSFVPASFSTPNYNLGNFRLVFRLLVALSREYLGVQLDSLRDRPHIVGATKMEFVFVDFIAQQEGIQLYMNHNRGGKFFQCFRRFCIYNCSSAIHIHLLD